MRMHATAVKLGSREGIRCVNVRWTSAIAAQRTQVKRPSMGRSVASLQPFPCVTHCCTIPFAAGISIQCAVHGHFQPLSPPLVARPAHFLSAPPRRHMLHSHCTVARRSCHSDFEFDREERRDSPGSATATASERASGLMIRARHISGGRPWPRDACVCVASAMRTATEGAPPSKQCVSCAQTFIAAGRSQGDPGS